MIKLKEGQKVLAEDGKLYEIEKGDVLKEGTLQEAEITPQEFCDEVKEIFSSYFPKSFVQASVSLHSMGNSVYIAFTLGKDKSEYVNGYAENDPMLHKLMIHEVTKEVQFEPKIELKLLTGHLSVLPEDPKYHYTDYVRVWRKISGTPEKVLLGFEKYIQKLYDAVKANADNMHEQNYNIKDKL